MHKTTVLLTTLLLATAPLAVGDGEDDAGSGGDAPDEEALAYHLPGTGTYEGALASSQDDDWYVTDIGSQAQCAQTQIDGSIQSAVTMVLTGPELQLVDRVDSLSGATLALAGHGLDQLEFGVTPGLSLITPLAGSYTFTMDQVRTDAVPAGSDAGSGRDAGETLGDALHVRHGCLGGLLSPSDQTDAYAFQVDESDHLLVSLAKGSGGDVTLEVVKSGAVVATLTDGELFSQTIDSSGTWYLRAEWSGDAGEVAYVVGVDVTEGDGPCRPYCLR